MKKLVTLVKVSLVNEYASAHAPYESLDEAQDFFNNSKKLNSFDGEPVQYHVEVIWNSGNSLVVKVYGHISSPDDSIRRALREIPKFVTLPFNELHFEGFERE